MASASAGTQPTESGRIVACFGRRTLVETAGGETLSCVSRARRSGVACGDIARISRTSAGEGVIEAIEPRASVFYRSDARREKLIAANVDQVLLILAVTPAPNEDFIDRCLAAAESASVQTVIVLNKIDHTGGREQARERLAEYRALGYRCVELCALTTIDSLRAFIADRQSVLLGQSGVGKSTILNQLVPDAHARVGEISSTRASGRHTTTHAQLYRIDPGSALIDSPGMQSFGLHQLTLADLAQAFIEFRPLIGGCRFSNCAHLDEPGCAIGEAAAAGRILRRRIESYRRIAASLTRSGQY